MNDLMNKIVHTGSACIILLILLTGCSHQPKTSDLVPAKRAFDELRTAVLREIKDPDRAARGVSLVDQLEQLMVEANDDQKAHVESILSLNANYDATEEDFRAILREFNAKRIDRQERIIDINQQAKDLTTEAEWKAIAKVQEKIVRKTLEACQEM